MHAQPYFCIFERICCLLCSLSTESVRWTTVAMAVGVSPPAEEAEAEEAEAE